MSISNREEQLCEEIARIEQSTLSPAEYIQRYGASFSLAQFYRYRAQLSKQGVIGLKDKRRNGNHRKLGSQEIAFLRGFIKNRSSVNPSQAQKAIAEEFGIVVHRSTMSALLKKLGVVIPLTPKAVKQENGVIAGFELIAALAIHLGWTKHTAQEITTVIDAQANEKAGRQTADKCGRNAKGQFTKRYNQRPSVRKMRFASIELKRLKKDIRRMDLFNTSLKNIERKVLAILALPLVTLNGQVRQVDTALGNALKGFCGYNYKQATLDLFLRELKYLGVSEQLLGGQVRFWYDKWQLYSSELKLPFLCYYIDGNTKPVWSKFRVMQNKVTMLGRVMGCLEQVFVHDCFGHPIYFETYCGHGPMGVYTLSLMAKVEQYLEEVEGTASVTRVLVMDGASNSVETLRAFASQTRYHYITTLDKNQWSARKIRIEQSPERYYWGAATLYDGKIELEDSKEKGYLVVVRTVRIEWDHGKRTVLLTSLPEETVGPSMVVKGYFERWPQQELTFQKMKGFASIHRVAGYGKQLVEEPDVRDKQQKLEQKIKAQRLWLKEPLEKMATETAKLTELIEKERVLRCLSYFQNGTRILESTDAEALANCTREIGNVQKRMKTIEKQHEKEFKKLHRYENEWMRLQGKEVVYKIDVELDQIMTYFRVSLSNICAYFLKEFLQMGPTSFSTLMQSILLLTGDIEETKEQRKVVLRRNPKDPAMMDKLDVALVKLNACSLTTLSGKRYRFFLS